jgi:CubicO group peptidase (beta-lactamase class C family)
MEVAGSVAVGFEPVCDVFAQVLTEQCGTAVDVRRDGRWLVDLWGGWVDSGRIRPWRADSIVQPYSASKPFAAICALVLVDRGKLALDAPVQEHWPDFHTRGSVRHLLSHQAGLVALDQPLPTEAFYHCITYAHC